MRLECFYIRAKQSNGFKHISPFRKQIPETVARYNSVVKLEIKLYDSLHFSVKKTGKRNE